MTSCRTRLALLLALLAAPCTLSAQTTPDAVAAQARVIRLADLSRVTELATLCRVRTQEWERAALDVAMDAAVAEAKKEPRATTGEDYVGSAAQYAFGAIYYALAAAEREFSQYGDTACAAVEHSGSLRLVDTMVRRKGGPAR